MIRQRGVRDARRIEVSRGVVRMVNMNVFIDRREFRESSGNFVGVICGRVNLEPGTVIPIGLSSGKITASHDI